MKRPDEVTLIAIYFFLVAIVFLLGLCAILGIPLPAVLSETRYDPNAWIGAAAIAFGALVTAIIGVLSLVAGFGLLRLKSWARWLAVVLAAISLFAFPIGTIIGALILWYLLSDKGRAAFETIAQSGGTE